MSGTSPYTKIRVGSPCDFCRRAVKPGSLALRWSVPPWDPDGTFVWQRFTLHKECAVLVFEQFGEEGLTGDEPNSFFEELIRTGCGDDPDGRCREHRLMEYQHSVEQLFEHPIEAESRGDVLRWLDFYRTQEALA